LPRPTPTGICFEPILTNKSPSPHQRMRNVRRGDTILHYTHSSGSLVFYPPHPAQGRRQPITLLSIYAS
jgi:hypothetical protein